MNLQYVHDRMRSALWKAGGKPRKAGETRDALWTLYTELDEHLAPAFGAVQYRAEGAVDDRYGDACVTTANGKTHVWPCFQAYWRCEHFPSAISNWSEGLKSCWVCGERST